MSRRYGLAGVLVPLMVAMLVMAVGCASGSEQRGKGKEILRVVNSIRARATKCAPEELAMAQAHVEFGLLELDEGDYYRSRRHMAIAYENVDKADFGSKAPECQERGDRDKDGIIDKEDGCPDEPEDIDGFQDQDGCPDADNDKDGILDVNDQCPNEPEDVDGDRDQDGCPDIEGDRDKDGLKDRVDKCPDEPEDKDGFMDDDGCPDPDNDGDGLVDGVDQCPNDPEDRDGFEDDNGCPDPDNDKDGIADVSDRCPNEPETYNGTADDDGCPDYTNVVVTAKRIEIKKKVHFSSGKAKILRDSHELLNNVSQVLLDNSKMRVRIEGHTDSRGSARYNQKLSQKRADSVRRYLIKQGIASSRLKAEGNGEDSPIEDNSSSEGREANRRVEFHIIANE